MRTRIFALRNGFTLAALGIIGSCSDSSSPRAVASVTISSPLGSRISVGKSVQLSAEARADDGSVIHGNSVAWSSSAPLTAEVVPTTGFVQLLAAGTANIFAEVRGIQRCASRRKY